MPKKEGLGQFADIGGGEEGGDTPMQTMLDNCTGNCNVLSPKICVPKETKEINVKTFNMI